jgi:hypothetical protein
MQYSIAEPFLENYDFSQIDQYSVTRNRLKLEVSFLFFFEISLHFSLSSHIPGGKIQQVSFIIHLQGLPEVSTKIHMAHKQSGLTHTSIGSCEHFAGTNLRNLNNFFSQIESSIQFLADHRRNSRDSDYFRH